MAISFKRITSSVNFIPEIDGLRFIAITSVVLYHLSHFLTVKTSGPDTGTNVSLLQKILANGNLGVPLFFAISGFILGMPFAKFHLQNGNPVSLKKYFFRRLTRLEPPYILVMTVLLFSVLLTKKMPLTTALESYLSSIFYIHNFVYGKAVMPLLNAVAWSLEIEVQFYILAPLMGFIFSIRSASARRVLMGGIACFFLILNYFINLPFISLINYIQYFFIGFLLVDLYLSNSFILPKTKFDTLIALVFFTFLWLFNKGNFDTGFKKCIWELTILGSIFLFYYYVLIHKVFKFLSLSFFTNIGGMCYSIYLLHYPIISLIGNPLLKHSFSRYVFVNLSIYSIVLLLAVGVNLAIFFLHIERPCMDKDWYKKFAKPSWKVFKQPAKTFKPSGKIAGQI